MFLYIHRLFLVVVIFCHIQCGWTKFYSYNPYCYYQECCNEGWIEFNRGRLTRNLTDRVYGQPLLQTAVTALASHFNPYFPPNKALTLSFHGMTGTGKNYVSKFIAESMFTEGTKSKYVHNFMGRIHFSEASKLKKYQDNLYQWIKGNTTNCPRQLFIFDEVDKMVRGVLDILKPVIDYRDEVEGVSYGQAVFIFLSNTAADIINEHFHDLYITEGRNREDLTLSDFETLIKTVSFNKKGGFQYCDPIKDNLIDHYIPFLPLEQKHVVMCIKDEFKLRKILQPKKEHIAEIMKFIEWGPDASKIFSKTGCKRIGPKVGSAVAKYYAKYAFASKDEL